MKLILSVVLSLLILTSCAEKNPPRDEIPKIKDVLAKLEAGIKSRNAALIDSFIFADSFNKGCNSLMILSKIDSCLGDSSFHSIGKREFFYTKDRANVTCRILADARGEGYPTQISLIHVGDRWLIENFEVK
jgi:hypothetical protein